MGSSRPPFSARASQGLCAEESLEIASSADFLSVSTKKPTFRWVRTNDPTTILDGRSHQPLRGTFGRLHAHTKGLSENDAGVKRVPRDTVLSLQPPMHNTHVQLALLPPLRAAIAMGL